MPWFPNPNGGAPIQAATNPNPAGGSYGYYSDPGYSGPAPSVGGASSSGGASGASSGSVTPASSPQLAAGIQGLLSAAASGNKAAIDEAIREFNKTFGLDQDKFNDDIRRFNENLAISQAGLTGQYQGQQTQQAQRQAADIGAQTAGLTGYYSPYQPGSFISDPASGAVYSIGPNGQVAYIGDPRAIPAGARVQAVPGLGGPVQTATGFVPAGLPGGVLGQQTMAREQQTYAQQMGMIAQAASLQANPFRQQQAIGQMGNLLGGQGVAGFSAPNTVQGVGTAGGNNQGGLGYLSQMIQDIRDPTPNQTSMNDVLNGIPTPNKLNSNEFLRAAPSTQSMVLQGMQEKYGIDPNDALAQIKNTLPQFQAPTTVGAVKR